MRKMARMKRHRSYSENSTLDTLKIASDVMTKPLNITSNVPSTNDENWRKNSVLPRRRYLSVGKFPTKYLLTHIQLKVGRFK